jgi:hypothetical protein
MSPATFSSKELGILSAAIEEAWQCVQASGANYNDDEESARMALGREIFALVKHGEWNQQQLVDSALLRFKL